MLNPGAGLRPGWPPPAQYRDGQTLAEVCVLPVCPLRPCWPLSPTLAGARARRGFVNHGGLAQSPTAPTRKVTFWPTAPTDVQRRTITATRVIALFIGPKAWRAISPTSALPGKTATQRASATATSVSVAPGPRRVWFFCLSSSQIMRPGSA